MAFLKYTDLPIFADFTAENTNPTKDAAKTFAVTDASLALDPNLTANRYLGKSQIKNDFALTGPLEGKFSMTFYPMIEKLNDTSSSKLLNIQKANQLAFFDLTGDFSQGHKIYLQNYLLQNCFLQNYSIKINAYQPVSVTANFVSYNVTDFRDTVITQYDGAPITIPKNTTIPSYETLHGLTTLMNEESSNNIPELKTSIEINVDCQRVPLYTLGNAIPTSVKATSVERTVTIQGDNINKAVSLSGANPGSTNIYFLPLSSLNTETPSSSNKVLNFDINGRVISQQLSISQNAILNGKVVIKEILL